MGGLLHGSVKSLISDWCVVCAMVSCDTARYANTQEPLIIYVLRRRKTTHTLPGFALYGGDG